MKSNKGNIIDLTEAKELLEKVEGGLSDIDVTVAVDKAERPCDPWNCNVPLYGVITDID